MLAMMGVERLVEELGVVKVVEVNSVWSAVCWGFFWVVGFPTTAGNKVSLSVFFFGRDLLEHQAVAKKTT